MRVPGAGFALRLLPESRHCIRKNSVQQNPQELGV